MSVTLRYLDAWLRGNGAAAIDNLMEDAATAEISRSQLWQWRRHRTALDDGRPFDDARYAGIRDEELDRIGRDTGRVAEAAALLDGLVLDRRLRRVPDPRGVSLPRLTGGPSASAPGGAPRTGRSRGARRTTPSRTTNAPRTIVERTAPRTSRPSYGV